MTVVIRSISRIGNVVQGILVIVVVRSISRDGSVMHGIFSDCGGTKYFMSWLCDALYLLAIVVIQSISRDGSPMVHGVFSDSVGIHHRKDSMM